MGVMSSGKDDKFGQTAVQLGYLSDRQVSECVTIQGKMRAMGIDEPLGEILVKKGYLTVLQKQNVLKKLGVHTSPIPGYTILGKIGQGGMGAVYKANQTSVNRTVAIKILSQVATRDKTYIARFLQEAQAAAALDHKNLISAIDVGEANGIYYFVMEFVTGKSCREILNTKGPFDQKTLMDIALQTGEVLDHIHRHNMIHRDIKPENIMLTPEGTVKLCDLGLAKSTLEMEQSLTQTGLTVGTPYFMPPEQVRGDRDVDIRADFYSLGGTLYYLASGKYPYEGKSAAETMSLHLNKPVPDVRKAVPKMTEDFSSVIQKLMAKDRAHRYQTPAELVQDLRKLKAGTTPQLAREHAARAHLVSKAHSRSRVLVRKSNATLPILAACGAGAIVLGILLFSGSSTSRGPRTRPRPPVARETLPPPIPRVRSPEPAPTPKDDPARVGEAARLFSSAEQFMKQEKWDEARASLVKLRDTYKDLQYVAERSATIGENIGVCESKVVEIREAQDRLIAEARTAAREARWQGARSRYEQLVEAGRTEFRRDIDTCEQEILAGAYVAGVDAEAEKKDWTKVKAQITGAAGKFALTKTVRREQDRLALLLRRATEELEAARILQDATAAGVARKWMGLERHLVLLEQRRSTDTYKANGKVIRDLQAKLQAGNKAVAERMAEKSWQTALRDYNKRLDDRKYAEAEQVIRDFLARYIGTETHKKRQAEANLKINGVRRRKENDRKSDSRDLYSTANKLYAARKFSEALPKFRELAATFKNTAVWRSYGNRILQRTQDCENRLGTAKHVLVNQQFEEFPGFWTVRGGATANNNGPGYESERSAKIFVPNGNTARVQHPLKGVTSDVETFSFWAKTVRKGPVALITFSILDDDDSFAVDVSITNTWKQHTFKVRDFRPYGNTSKRRPNLDQIRMLMIDSNGGGPHEFLFDRLRIEKKPAPGRR